MMTLEEKKKKALKCSDKLCQLCNQPVYIDQEEFEYIETKRKSKYLIHSQCIVEEFNRKVDI